jgi:hypothetical protein
LLGLQGGDGRRLRGGDFTNERAYVNTVAVEKCGGIEADAHLVFLSLAKPEELMVGKIGRGGNQLPPLSSD